MTQATLLSVTSLPVVLVSSWWAGLWDYTRKDAIESPSRLQSFVISDETLFGKGGDDENPIGGNSTLTVPPIVFLSVVFLCWPITTTLWGVLQLIISSSHFRGRPLFTEKSVVVEELLHLLIAAFLARMIDRFRHTLRRALSIRFQLFYCYILSKFIKEAHSKDGAGAGGSFFPEIHEDLDMDSDDDSSSSTNSICSARISRHQKMMRRLVRIWFIELGRSMGPDEEANVLKDVASLDALHARAIQEISHELDRVERENSYFHESSSDNEPLSMGTID